MYRGKEETEPKEQYVEAGCFRVNKDFNEVTKNGEVLDMTDIEYKIFRLLAQYRNKIFSIQNIYESVWEKPYFYDANNTVMVHIRRLRMAVEDDPRHPSYIRTEWGRGYRFVCE
jgi:DNA-binding response OmpR family regulator